MALLLVYNTVHIYIALMCLRFFVCCFFFFFPSHHGHVHVLHRQEGRQEHRAEEDRDGEPPHGRGHVERLVLHPALHPRALHQDHRHEALLVPFRFCFVRCFVDFHPPQSRSNNKRHTQREREKAISKRGAKPSRHATGVSKPASPSYIYAERPVKKEKKNGSTAVCGILYIP